MTSGMQESHKHIFSNLKDVFREKVDQDVILLVLTECEWKAEEAFERLFSICGEPVSVKEINKLSEIADEIFQESYNDLDIENDVTVTPSVDVNGFSDDPYRFSGNYDFDADCNEISGENLIACDNDLCENDISCALNQQSVRNCKPVFESGHSQQTHFLDQDIGSTLTGVSEPDQSKTLHASITMTDHDVSILRDLKPNTLRIPAAGVLEENQHISENARVTQTISTSSKSTVENGSGLVHENTKTTINMEDIKMPYVKSTDVNSATPSSGSNMATPLEQSATESAYKIRSVSPIVNLSPNAPVFVPYSYYQSSVNVSKDVNAFRSPPFHQDYGAPTFLTPKVVKSGRPGCKPTFSTQYSNPGMEVNSSPQKGLSQDIRHTDMAKKSPQQRVSQDIRYADMAMKSPVTSKSANKQVDKPKKTSGEDKAKQLLQQHRHLMIIMRGCPGSGKTTLAREIVRNSLGGVILSTDDYFGQGDNYNYDINLLTEAHEWNKLRAKKSMDRGVSPVIIDNTNSQAWEMKPYVKMGLDHGYYIEIMEPDTPWKFKVKELKKRTIHGVTSNIIKNMVSRYQHNLTVNKILNSASDGPDAKPEASKGNKPEANMVKKPEANMGKKPDANLGKNAGKRSAALLVAKACDVRQPMAEMLPDVAKQPHCISGNLPDIAKQSDVMKLAAVRLLDGFAQADAISARSDNKQQGVSKPLRNSNGKRQPIGLHHVRESTASSTDTKSTAESTTSANSEERDKIVQIVNDSLASTSAANVDTTQRELEAFIYLSPLSQNEKQELNALLTKKISEIIIIKSDAGKGSESIIKKTAKRLKLGGENVDHSKVSSSVDLDKQHRNVTNNAEEFCKPETLSIDFALSNASFAKSNLDFGIDITEETDKSFDNNVWEKPKPRRQHARNKIANSDIENDVSTDSDSDINKVHDASDIGESTKCGHNNENSSHLTAEKDVLIIDSHQISKTNDFDSSCSINDEIGRYSKESASEAIVITDMKFQAGNNAMLSISPIRSTCNDLAISKDNEQGRVVEMANTNSEIIDNDVSKLGTDVVRPKEPKNVSPRKRKDSKLKGPFLDLESKQKFLNEQWKMPQFDETETHAVKASTSPPRAKSTRDMETVTSPHDFNDLYWVNSGAEASDFKTLKIKHTTWNFGNCLTSATEDSENSVSEINYNWKLDKGSSTNDLCLTSLENDVEFLQNCFPDVEKEDLKDIFTLCDNNVEWSVNLLVDSDNLSKIDKGKLLEKMENKKGKLQVSIKQIVEEQDSNKNNPGSLLDMCVSVAISNNIMSDAQIQDQLIRSGFDRLQAMENVSLRAALPSKDIPESPKMSMITSPRPAVTPEQNIFRLDKKAASQDSFAAIDDIPYDLNMTSDILDLAIPEQFAKNLVHLFGSADAINTDNLPLNAFQVSLDYRTCQLIYECWQRTMKTEIIKKNTEQDEVLARRLQEEENKGRKFKPHSVYLDQIISEEVKQHAARQKQQQNLKESGDQNALATQLKRQDLRKRFPCIDEAVIEEIFEDNRYSLSDTINALRLLDANDRPGYDLQTIEDGIRPQHPIHAAANQSVYDMLDNGYRPPHKAYQLTESPEYEDYRGELNVHYKIRNECFQKAKEAYSRGMKDVAFFYSQQGHLHTEKIKEAKHRATTAILADKNRDLSRSNSIDLHGLHVDEALDVLQQLLEQREIELRNNPDKRRNHLLVITGRGSHSRDGRARIRPAVLEFLRKNSYR